MIAFVRGTIADVQESAVVIENNGVGYGVFITSRDAHALNGRKDEVKLYTYLNVREDAMQLFGFLSREDLAVFKLLLGVNGIGPKAALGVLSALTAADLRFAVLSDDAKTLAAAPGIGKKTAQKMILELRDKFDLEEMFDRQAQDVQAMPSAASGDRQAEAVQALVALGYSGSDALKAVKMAGVTEEMSVEDILKAALKHMSF